MTSKNCCFASFFELKDEPFRRPKLSTIFWELIVLLDYRDLVHADIGRVDSNARVVVRNGAAIVLSSLLLF